MTELYIDDKKAYMNESTSIKLVDENSYLTKSSKYTYDIELPLIGNSDNIAIFKNIHRLDVSKIILNQKASMISNNRNIINGISTITSITDSAVKVQVLSGNAELNFLSKYEGLYIDELALGSMVDAKGTPMFGMRAVDSLALIKDESARLKKMFGTYGETDFVFFPVHNEKTGLVYNEMCLRKMTDTTETIFWRSASYGGATPPGMLSSSWGRASGQPYFCVVVNKIFESLGYTVIENQILNTPLKNIFIVNHKEDAQYSKVLPHWTMSEFIEQVERFFGVVFKIDDNKKSVRVLLRKSWGDEEDIQIEDVIDEYSVNCDEEETTDISNGNVSYAFENVDKYLKIDEDVLKRVQMKYFESHNELQDFYSSLSESDKKKYIYQACGKQFIQYDNNLREVNQYRNLNRNEGDDSAGIELKIVPTKMISARTRWESCYFDDFFNHWIIAKGVDFNSVMMSVSGNEEYSDGNQNVQDMIEGNTVSENTKDVIEVAMNDGIFQRVTTDDGNSVQYFPWPFVLTNDPLQASANRGFSFELNKIDDRITMYDVVFDSVIKINTQCEMVIKFVTDQMYDTMKRFIIRNKSYICKKIEYKVDIKGIDPLKTGYFYEVT